MPNSLIESGCCAVCLQYCFDVKEWNVSDTSLPKRIGAPYPDAWCMQMVLSDGSRSRFNVHADCRDGICLREIWQRILATNLREMDDTDYRAKTGLTPLELPEVSKALILDRFDGLVPIGLLSARLWSDMQH